MKRSTVAWLIIAALLVASGTALFCIVMSRNAWNFDEITTTDFVSNRYDLDEIPENIDINTDTADLIFKRSDDDKVHVICYEDEKVKHEVSISGGVLYIKAVDQRALYEHVSVVFDTPEVTVMLPEGKYRHLQITESTGNIVLPEYFSFKSVNIEASTGNVTCNSSASEELNIKLSTGHITLQDVSAESVRLETSTGWMDVKDLTCSGELFVKLSTGKSTLSNVTCDSFVSTGSTGRTIMDNVIVEKKMSVTRSTGDIEFSRCDAAEVHIVTDTGDVKGSFMTDKRVTATSDTGRIKVPDSSNGGICEVRTDTGNITINIE